ncbi:MAG TPA: hypothetical protein PLR37_16565 [Candidatus Accumulibacter phosphatis]|uniref:hypothetical protein n=1 Tax=Accumulibacter sp. TaxID=2053492 RepID=UPI0025834E38|nr:hypothetical protein [Accumulibacter sp.]HRF13700.1 hypothetical protein [Candidatus Accumulibacter phosphatis]
MPKLLSSVQSGHHHFAQILDLVGDRDGEPVKLAHLHWRRLAEVLDVRTSREGLAYVREGLGCLRDGLAKR